MQLRRPPTALALLPRLAPQLDAAAAPAAPASSRFNMDTLEEKKKPAFQRGKDGHLTLAAADDFFSNPLGGAAGRSNSLGGCRPRPGGAEAVSRGLSPGGRSCVKGPCQGTGLKAAGFHRGRAKLGLGATTERCTILSTGAAP